MKFYYDDNGYKWIKEIDADRTIDVVITKIALSIFMFSIGFLSCLILCLHMI